jgi:hypothetical protein
MRPWTTTVAVHGGPRVVVAEGLAGDRARGRSAPQELVVKWGKGGGAPGGGGVLTEGFSGRFDGKVRPAAVKGEQPL